MKWKASVLVLSVFLLGLLVGALGLHVMLRSQADTSKQPVPLPATTDEVVKQLDEKCSLTLDQQKQIRAIMVDVMAEYQRLYDPIRPEIEQVRQAGRQRIRGLLTSDQLPKFEEYLRHMDEERKKLEHK